jgi:mRNA interferase MazF
MAEYVSKAGDIVWLNFKPQAGYEQAERRPRLVVSPAAQNEKTSLMIYRPGTKQVKNYPFEVHIADVPPGVAPADQEQSLDWRVGKAKRSGAASAEELGEARANVVAILG